MSEANTKARLLFIEQYMMENTDEAHPISTDELISIYEAHGYKANRNTVHDDIEVLRSVNIDVIDRREGNAKVYFIGGRLFELAEVKTLVDAVSSSRFITKEKSKALIAKLTELTSVHNRKPLMKSSFFSDRIKTSSRNIFASIDTVNEAISRGKKITFQYIDYLPDKSPVLRHDGKVYKVSPYALLWNDDRYYAPSYSEEKDCIVPFRIDRMRKVAVSDEDAYKTVSFDPAEYSRKVLKMYDSNEKECEVRLLAENRYMINIIDRFGERVGSDIIDDGHFVATVTVKPSATFFAWVVQFGGGIRIVSPEKVKAGYKKLLEDILASQENLE